VVVAAESRPETLFRGNTLAVAVAVAAPAPATAMAAPAVGAPPAYSPPAAAAPAPTAPKLESKTTISNDKLLEYKRISEELDTIDMSNVANADGLRRLADFLATEKDGIAGTLPRTQAHTRMHTYMHAHLRIPLLAALCCCLVR
jgi:hypothetical protein